MGNGFIELHLGVQQYDGFCTLETPTLSILRAVEITGQLIANQPIASEANDFLDIVYRYGTSLIHYRPDELFEAWLIEFIAMLEALNECEQYRTKRKSSHDLHSRLESTIDELNAFVRRLRAFPNDS